MLEDDLKELKLVSIGHQLDMWLQEAARHSWPYAVFLEKLCQEELGTRREKRCDLSIKSAKFPYTKT
ncbi:MAG: ATP-binding protein, partial [Alphaproteobacteria bacterium]|nr:ATP-binding protein [Alphaproteobacteria bacterium]